MTREEVLMPIAAIAMDRWPHQPKTLEYAKALEAGAVFPPIKVHFHAGRWRIGDGRHRLLAHKLCGRTHILVRRAPRPRSGS
jgi:ParB-like chromosome segregation protein Spo0J